MNATDIYSAADAGRILIRVAKEKRERFANNELKRRANEIFKGVEMG